MNRIPTAAAWKLLLTGTTHVDAIVRCDAARLLGLLGDRRAVPALSRMLETDAHLSKITAVYALGDIGERKAAPVLRRIAADPGVFRFPGMHYHDMIRLAAALSLARWNDPSGVLAVNDVLRLRGLPAMLELGPAILSARRTPAMKRLRDYLTLPFVLSYHVGKSSASNHFFVDQCLAFFRDPAGRKQLVADLTHFSRYVRPEAAASLLVQDPSPANLRLVSRQAKQENTPFGIVRFARILHEHGAGEATPALAKGLRSKDAFVRATALDAAAALKLTTLAPVVRDLLADSNFYVRICAAEAMESLAGRSAIGELLPLLGDPHPRVVIQAAKSLLACRHAQ